MPDTLVPVADGFWNLRGSFHIFRFINIGTQSALARLRSGGFVLLDSYPLRGAVREQVDALTDGGRAIEAIFNLHPFHTVHVRAAHQALPHAALYGTARHQARAPELPWADVHTEDPAFAARFAEDFELLVPAGVDLVCANEHVHFGSVLAIHRASRTLYVDDTLGFTPLPLVGGVTFHPGLSAALQQRPGAAAAFRAWAQALVERCREIDHLCVAHTRPLPAGHAPVADLVAGALRRVEGALAKHEARWG
ncbi:MAG TPA: hypothetical protein PKA64_06640 [Myxococcota bacterium]|nr:hypothetical protein [Myxococcota bacterium]